MFSRLKRNVVHKINCILLGCIFLTPFVEGGELPYIRDLLPQTVNEMNVLWSEYEMSFRAATEQFYASLENNEPGKAIRAWDKAAEFTIVSRTKFGYVIPSELHEEVMLVDLAKHYLRRTDTLFNQIVSEPSFKKSLCSFCLKSENLLPHEAHFFKSMLEKLQQKESSLLLEQAIHHVAQFQRAPFIFLKGRGKKREKGSMVTILSGNVLFMPDLFTYFFGGVSSWVQRVDALASLFIEKGADVICLQEVHDGESAYQLYDRLKNDYAYFHMNIGTDHAVLNSEELSLNSGLFIASKLPIEDPDFKKYDVEGMQKGIHKGYFYGVLQSKQTPLCYLISTHLNPFENEVATRVRETEAQEVVAKIKEMRTIYPLPSLLVGDLNINWGSQEWKNSILSQTFFDVYEEKAFTCTDTFNDLVWTIPKERDKVVKEGHICDYALVDRESSLKMRSTICPFYLLEKPTEALSDHQGIFTEITLSPIDERVVSN